MPKSRHSKITLADLARGILLLTMGGLTLGCKTASLSQSNLQSQSPAAPEPSKPPAEGDAYDLANSLLADERMAIVRKSVGVHKLVRNPVELGYGPVKGDFTRLKGTIAVSLSSDEKTLFIKGEGVDGLKLVRISDNTPYATTSVTFSINSALPIADLTFHPADSKPAQVVWTGVDGGTVKIVQRWGRAAEWEGETGLITGTGPTVRILDRPSGLRVSIYWPEESMQTESAYARKAKGWVILAEKP